MQMRDHLRLKPGQDGLAITLFKGRCKLLSLLASNEIHWILVQQNQVTFSVIQSNELP